MITNTIREPRTLESADRRQVELSVCGSMALESEAADWACSELRDDMFGEPDCRIVFRALCRMRERGVPADPVTLADELARSGELAAAGGADGVAEILLTVPHASHVRFYGEQLQESHRRTRLRAVCERGQRSAADPTIESAELIAAILSELEGIRGDVSHSELIDATGALERMHQRAEPGGVVATGLPSLDRILRGGLRPGQICVIAGRPGTGKSALMAQVILGAAGRGVPAMFATLEMTSAELAERAVRSMRPDRFAGLPVWFSEAADFLKLTGLIRLAKRQHGVQLAAVDYLQLAEVPHGKNDLRERQVATMSRGLKRLAIDLKVPILLGSQLNRESEKRGRPSLADLRESGAIEQDADIVVLLSRSEDAGETELIVAKHRGGPRGIARCGFDGPTFQFRDWCEPFVASDRV